LELLEPWMVTQPSYQIVPHLTDLVEELLEVQLLDLEYQ
jgi:hypothetical protein